MIKNLLGIVWAMCEWGLGIFKANNTKEMQLAKVRQDQENLKAQINDTIEKRNIKEIRNDLSE